MRRGGRAALAAAAALGLAASSAPQLNGPSFDRYGRVQAMAGKQEVVCPAPGERVAVLVVAGQSNAGNHGELRADAAISDRIVNFHQGRCWRAEAPWLGATGLGAAYWDLLATHLLDSGRYDHVVVAPFAVGGSRASRWGEGGDLHRSWQRMLTELQRHHRVTHVLWHQGEADFLLGTPELLYAAHIASMWQAARKTGVSAPLYIALATRCTRAPWSADHPVARAQRRLAYSLPHALPGADADAVWGPGDRFDDCHFSAQGQQAMARRWAERLLSGASSPQ